LKPALDGGGYLAVSLSAAGRKRTFRVHALVLAAFAGPRPPDPDWYSGKTPYYEACHGPGGPEDNRYPENLSWDTKHKNAQDRERDGTVNRGERNGRNVLSEDQTREVQRRDGADAVYA